MSVSLPEPILPGPFEPTWDSLRTYECPDWFRDAKFGIWAHWGPQCVPLCGDWYARRIYQPNDWAYHHHWRVYGHPSKFGYKDIVKLWKAENFDPEGLMDLYQAAGAKYFFGQAVHHDNFDNWDSKHQRWNSVKVGPQKNITALWQAAARKRGLKFGLSEHLGAAFTWNRFNKNSDPDGPYAGVPYDGNDPDAQDLYLPNHDEPLSGWYTENPWWHEQWFKRMKDVIDQHQPDLFYSDGGVPFGEVGLNIIAHLYNTSAAVHGTNQAVYNQKDTKEEIYTVGVLDIERGQRHEIARYPWQTDTCVAGWYFDSRAKYKSPNHVIEMLVDIVSKNGNLLLNFTQMPDGSLDEQCRYILACMAEWTAVNGEGLYGTRPWVKFGEGPSAAPTGHFKEDAVAWTPQDFRFTAKGQTIYAFQMKDPDGRLAAITSLGADSGHKVVDVKLLGCDADLLWKQAPGALQVKLPDAKVVQCAPCLKVTLA